MVLIGFLGGLGRLRILDRLILWVSIAIVVVGGLFVLALVPYVKGYAPSPRAEVVKAAQTAQAAETAEAAQTAEALWNA
jgi:hypothetical protein